MIYSNPIMYLQENTHGRDFCIGDIHGEYDIIDRALIEANFDPDKDRLLVVGDCVDRGRQSERALEFLRRPYVFAVRGNHEDMFLELYEQGIPESSVLNYVCSENGMNWWLDIDEALRQDFIEQFSKMPLVMEVATSRGTVGILHAEVPRGMDWDTFKHNIQIQDQHTIASCLWGRSRDKYQDDSGVAGVGRIFSGHTIQEGSINKLGNVYFIDTGSVFRALYDVESVRLSMPAILAKTEAILIRPNPESPLQVIDFEEPPKNPFGVYHL